MAYDLAGIRERVIDDKLDDPDYDTNIVDRFINDAQRAIFNTYELPFAEKVFVGTMASAGYIYTFPTDYQTAQALKITNPVINVRDITKMYVPFRDFNTSYPTPSNNDPSAPSIWTLHANKLYFSQPTDQDYDVELYYIKKPALLDDGADVPEIPSEFEELLVLGAYIRVLERNEDFDLAAFYRNGEYQDQLDQLEIRYGHRQTGKTMTMGQPLRSGIRRSGRR